MRREVVEDEEDIGELEVLDDDRQCVCLLVEPGIFLVKGETADQLLPPLVDCRVVICYYRCGHHHHSSSIPVLIRQQMFFYIAR
jgi:hypothetical protein